MVPKFRVFIDFDGTLVVPNVAILLVEKFAEGGMEVAHEVDEQLHAQKITLREAWERQVALLPADRVGEMTAWAVANIPLRAGARELLAALDREHVPVAIVSGGLDFYIRAVLEREGFAVPFVSDTLELAAGGKLTVAHPYGHATCRLCGICKAQVVRSPRPAAELTVFIGDGSTDRYGAEVADVVFARHRLRKYCTDAGIPFISFEDFDTVRLRFEGWWAGTEAIPARTALGVASSACPISRWLVAPPTPAEPADATGQGGLPVMGSALGVPPVAGPGGVPR